MPGELAIGHFENAIPGTRLNQALLERPDRVSIRNLATGAQFDEVLETQAIK